MMGLLYAFPGMATALPKMMFAPDVPAVSAPASAGSTSKEDDLTPPDESLTPRGGSDLGFGGAVQQPENDLTPKNGDDVKDMFK